MKNETNQQDVKEDDDMTLMEIIFRNKMVLLLCFGLFLSGCGRKWERFWGQDTRQPIQYITLTPDMVEFPVGSLNPTEWADMRFKQAKFMSVWACMDNNECIAIPEDCPSVENEMVVYVVKHSGSFESIISIYNVKSVYPGVTKIRVQVVL
jgi:hypothetical protein